MLQRLESRSNLIRLADEPRFALGPLAVDPPARTVSRAGVAERLEPRAMQMLVCLAERQGQVVGRETLVHRCWEGRIVGDDSVNRVVAQLRRLAKGLGAGAFAIETIPRVGYRIQVQARPLAAPVTAPARRPPPAPALSRRGVFLVAAAGAAAGAAAVGGAASLVLRAPADPLAPERLLLVGRADRWKEAEALLRARLAETPDDSGALGLLALAHARSALDDFGAGDQARIQAGQAAAAAALARDPGNADATVARAMIRPFYRNWQAYEAAVEAALAQFPGHWLGNFALAQVRYQTGRYREALAPVRTAVAAEPLCPAARHGLALVQWSVGDLAVSDATQRESIGLFPADPILFQQRFDFLALTGRPGEARALGALGYGYRPPDDRLPLAPPLAAAALGALESGGSAARTAAVEGLVAARRSGKIASFEASPWLAALGAPAEALAILPGYFLGAGPITSASQRSPRPGYFCHTCFLLMPPMAPLWPLPGFRALLAAVGLEDFWKKSGTKPDFRS